MGRTHGNRDNSEGMDQSRFTKREDSLDLQCENSNANVTETMPSKKLGVGMGIHSDSGGDPTTAASHFHK